MAHSTHILPALKMLRIFLFGLAKRRIQPERYVQYPPKIFEKLYQRALMPMLKNETKSIEICFVK
jgi:hypothetical protein